MSTPPAGLGSGGRRLWRAIDAEHDLDVAQQVQLVEACRAKDRLDRLDVILRGDPEGWRALSQANATANLMKQLLAALCLPDAQTGKRPHARGPRGAVKPQVPSRLSPKDRLRAVSS